MTRRQVLPALLVAAATAAVAWFVVTADYEVPLVPVEQGPRPPVKADPRTPHPTLAGLRDPLPERGNELRKRRNALAEEHRRALQAWRDGRGSLREAERVEQALWAARAQVGEIDARDLHQHLAELFERERERLLLFHANGLAGEDQLQRAALYVARERHLAGLPWTDERWPDYEAQRAAYLAAYRKRNEALVEGGLAHREQYLIDLRQLEHEFPELPPAKDGDTP